jgi:AcrR family transcriptional regulator
MGRWEPDARGRLEQAALELFQERGYTGTTVQEIAARAGLTERTFFRYFTDKREVLFWGAGHLQKLFVDTIADAPETTTPLDAVAAALRAAHDALTLGVRLHWLFTGKARARSRCLLRPA